MNLLRWSKGRGLLLLTLCSFLFYGCGAKVLPLRPLPDDQRATADKVLLRYLEQPLPEALDADVHLSWDIFGSKGNLDGVLQLQRPASIRLTALDPLGRALLIIVVDNKTFTIIDSRTGRAYKGEVASETWHQYVPILIEPKDLFYLLGGFISVAENRLFTGSGRVENSQEVWYGFSDTSGTSEQRLLLDQSDGYLKRRLMLDSESRPAIDVLYSDYLPVASGTAHWPRQIDISGEAVRGKFRLEIQQVASVAPLPARAFDLSIPRHFTVDILP